MPNTTANAAAYCSETDYTSDAGTYTKLDELNKGGKGKTVNKGVCDVEVGEGVCNTVDEDDNNTEPTSWTTPFSNACTPEGHKTYYSLYGMLTAFSYMSLLAVLCFCSVLSLGSVLSVRSMFSIMSNSSILSILSNNSILAIGCSGEILKCCWCGA